MRGNWLGWLEPVERKNNEDIFKMSAIKVEENRRRGKVRKKWMWIIGYDMKAYEVDKNLFKDRKRWNERIRVTDRIYVR